MTKKTFGDLLNEWPNNTIRDNDLAQLLKGKSDNARYALVKRALKAGLLICLRRGLYVIANKISRALPNEFEFALQIYEPSAISLESALSFHGWIPETVYVTTCITPKRSQNFINKFGVFSYKHVPSQGFYREIKRIEEEAGVIIFIATPWRALADFIYTRRKDWENLAQLQDDLRIDHDVVIKSDKAALKELCERYPSVRVRKILSRFLIEVSKKI